MPTETQEIVRAAIQLECDGREFYRKAAAASASDLARGTFEALADDELRHIEYIREVSVCGETLRTVNQRTYARLRGIFADAPDQVRREAAEAADDLAALNVAIDIEERSRAAYEALSHEVEPASLRTLCELLAGAEQFHRQLLENVVEYLEHPSDFFAREERWVVEG